MDNLTVYAVLQFFEDISQTYSDELREMAMKDLYKRIAQILIERTKE